MTDPIALYDMMLRGGAIALLALCAGVFSWRGDRRRKAFSVAALCAGLCGYLLISSPHGPPLPLPLHTGLVVIAGVVPVLVYWAGVELFLDEIIIAPWQWLCGGAVIVLAWGAMVIPALGLLRGALVLGLLAHLLIVVARGASGDLIEPRRRFRRWFLALMVLLGAIITAVELAGLDTDLPGAIYILHAAGFALLGAAFLIWSLRIAPDIWVQTRPAVVTAVSAADSALIERVNNAMQAGLWREEGLTIRALSERLNTQEHRLRRAINQSLGHRNFASFINGYRIESAQEILSDADQAERTILSIAYDVGFASLGPFNRAFRAATGQSPTDFRRARIHAAKDPAGSA